MTILEALADPQLFGGLHVFRNLNSWRTWLVFLAAFYGLPLSDLQPFGLTEDVALATFRKHTGRTTYSPPAGGYREAAAIVGRQAGKDRIGSVVQAFEAITASARGRRHRPVQRLSLPGRAGLLANTVCLCVRSIPPDPDVAGTGDR